MSLTRMSFWLCPSKAFSFVLFQHLLCDPLFSRWNPFFSQSWKKRKPQIILISLEGRRRRIISSCNFPELLCSSKSCGYKQRRRVNVHTHPHPLLQISLLRGSSRNRYRKELLIMYLVGMCWHDIFCFLFSYPCRHPATAEVYNE